MQKTEFSLSRRRFLGTGTVAAAAFSAPAFAKPVTRFDEAAYQKAIIFDAEGEINEDGRFKTINRNDLKTAGVTVVHATIGDVGNGAGRFEEMVREISETRGLIERNSDALQLILTAADIYAAKRAGRTGIMMDTQDTSAIEWDLSRVQTLHDLGIRTFQLTYNVRNLSGDGSLEKSDGGLSNFGHDMVAAINASNSLVDFSHGSRLTMAQGVAASKAPPIISHTGCRAIADHARNTDDETLRAVAQKGGVVGIYTMMYLSPGRQPTPEDFVRHLEHAIQICGEEHVGIGTDDVIATHVIDDAYRERLKKIFEARRKQGISSPGETEAIVPFPLAFNGPNKFRAMVQAFETAGWSSARIERVLGTNFTRVVGEVCR